MYPLETKSMSIEVRKLIGIEDLQAYLSVGRSTAMKIGKESGAERRYGRRCLYDRDTIDRYVDSLGA